MHRLFAAAAAVAVFAAPASVQAESGFPPNGTYVYSIWTNGQARGNDDGRHPPARRHRFDRHLRTRNLRRYIAKVSRAHSHRRPAADSVGLGTMRARRSWPDTSACPSILGAHAAPIAVPIVSAVLVARLERTDATAPVPKRRWTIGRTTSASAAAISRCTTMLGQASCTRDSSPRPRSPSIWNPPRKTRRRPRHLRRNAQSAIFSWLAS